MTRVVLALGSNLGDRLAHLRRGVASLERVGVVQAVSSLYESEAIGGPVQGRFLNAAVVVETDLSARKLMQGVLDIEHEAGRVRDMRWGPRTLDIDIITYGDERIDEADLTIPQPSAVERRFVLEPVAEIAPDVELTEQLTAGEALERTPAGGIHRWHGDWRTEHPSLGTLGVVLVGMQFLLFIVFAVVSVFTADVSPEPWRIVFGMMIAGLGGVLVAGAFFVLGKQLSALPDPRPDGRLVQGNVFAIVRHPIYGGLLLGGIGSAVMLTSSWSLLPLAALAVLFRFKSEMEERALTIAHPEYSSYRIRVPRRFIPIVW